MNKTVTITSKNHKYQSTYGGEIYSSDFSTDYTKGNIIDRIFSDWRCDEQCRKNIEIRKRQKEHQEEK